MSAIKVNWNSTYNMADRIGAHRSELSGIASTVRSVGNYKCMQGRGFESIYSALKKAAAQLDEEKNDLNRLQTGLDTISKQYSTTEMMLAFSVGGNLIDIIHSLPGVIYPGIIKPVPGFPGWIPGCPLIRWGSLIHDIPHTVPTKTNWWDRFKDGIEEKYHQITNRVDRDIQKAKDFIKEAYDTVKTGVAKTVDNIKDTVASFVDDYNNHGWTYKIWETTKSVVGIVGAVGGIVAATVAAVGSGGASVPLSLLTIINSGNKFINEVTDIANIWTGNYDQVNNVNILKDKLVEGGGQIGDWLGNKEIGEKVGETLYYAENIVSGLGTLEKLCNGMTWEQFKKGMEGTWDIFVHSDIKEVAKDAKLLSFEVPEFAKSFLNYDGSLFSNVKNSAESFKKLIIDVPKKIIENSKDIVAAWQ